MQGSRERWATISVALVGGLVGIAVLWLSRSDPPACTTLGDGMRACMPILVEGPAAWLYGAFGVIGALLGAGIAFGIASARGRRGTSRRRAAPDVAADRRTADQS